MPKLWDGLRLTPDASKVEAAVGAVKNAVGNGLAATTTGPRCALEGDSSPRAEVEREVGNPKKQAGDDPAERAPPIPVVALRKVPVAGVDPHPDD